MKNSPQEKILISSVRFRELINTLDISYGEFAKNVGTDRGSVSKFVSGKAKPSRGSIVASCFSLLIFVKLSNLKLL